MKRAICRLSIPIIGILLSFDLVSGISFTGNNTAKFGQGKNGYRYFENLSSLNIYEGNYRFFLQYELSNPPEFGLPYKGIRKRWIEYSTEDFSIKFGHIYTLWGRGLSLNLFDDQGTDYDNTIDGFYFTYHPGWGLNFDLIGGQGQIRNTYPNLPSDRPNRKERFDLYGAHVSMNNILNICDLGFSYIWSLDHSPYYKMVSALEVHEYFDTLKIEHRMPGIYFDIRTEYMDFYLEQVSRYTSFSPHRAVYATFPGMADTLDFSGRKYTSSVYSAFNLNLPLVSLIVDYKKYTFDVSDPESRRDFSMRPSTYSAYQNPPIVQKEHEWLLTSREMHVIDFNDEVGFQIEVQSSPFDFITLQLNYSKSSRNAAWIDTSSSWENSYVKKNLSNSFLPESADMFMPFSELILGGDVYLDNLYFQLYYVHNQEVKEFEKSLVKMNRLHRMEKITNTLPGEVEFIYGSHSLALKFEFQNYMEKSRVTMDLAGTESVINSKNARYNRFLQLTYSFSPYFSMGLLQEISSKRDPVSGNKKEWRGLETVVNLNSQNQLSIFIGSERGGLRCSSGICVPVPPIIRGARISLNSRF